MSRKALLRLAVAGGAAAVVAMGATGAASADSAHKGPTTTQPGQPVIVCKPVTIKPTTGQVAVPFGSKPTGKAGTVISVQTTKEIGGISVKGGRHVIACGGHGAGQCTVRVVKGGGILVSCTVGRHPVPLPIQPGGPIIKSGSSGTFSTSGSGMVSTTAPVHTSTR
jgi:hypothetical protein